MKKVSLIGLLVLFTFLLFNACDKKPLPEDCFKVKMHSYICGQGVFEIIDKNFQHLGEDGWKDGEGNILNNVFYSQLYCPDINLLDKLARPSYKGLEFNARIITVPDTSCVNCVCAICKALLHGPKTTLKVDLNTKCE